MHGRVEFSTVIDLWLIALILVASCGHFVFGLDLLAVGIALVEFMLFMAFVCSIRYELTADALEIRVVGLRINRIEYHAITAVRPSRSWLSAPAASLRRIRICYGRNRHVDISPRHRRHFLDLLSRRITCPIDVPN